MSEKPIVSIIIPAANDQDTIQRSVLSCTEQTELDIEVIVIVNNSSDKTYDICKSLSSTDKRIIVKKSFQPGRSVARNIGIDISKGKYLVFLDADDTLVKGRIRRSINVLNRKDKYQAYCENIAYVNSSTAEIVEQKKISASEFNELLYKNCFPINSLMLKNEDVVLFEENIEYNEDWLFWVENLWGKDVAFGDVIGGNVYITGRNTMSNKKIMLEYYVFVRSIINKKYPGKFLRSRRSNIALLLRYFSLSDRNQHVEHTIQKNMWEFNLVKLIFKVPGIKQLFKNKLHKEWRMKLY